ncbi:MAG: hypothetical protein WAO55_08950 [Candidatus Manganitrophaceae bacterium]
MQEQLNSRLNALKKEFETGQAKLQEVDRQQAYLRETLLRISGAIQVLEEMLTETKSAENGTPPLETPLVSGRNA